MVKTSKNLLRNCRTDFNETWDVASGTLAVILCLNYNLWLTKACFIRNIIRNIVSKGPKYRFPSYINFNKCREEIASALNDFGNRWCIREGAGDGVLKAWKRSISTIVDKRIKRYK